MLKPIFLLEDDPAELERLKHDINQQLHIPIIAMTSSDKAIDWLGQFPAPCAAFILDIEMKSQKYSGIQVAEKIRQNPLFITTPIIFLTSYGHFGRGALQHIHYYHFMNKPYAMSFFIQILSEAISPPSPNSMQISTLLLESTHYTYELPTEDISCIEQFGSKIVVTDLLGKESTYIVKTNAFSHICGQIKELEHCPLHQVHRSVVINFNRIQKIDWKKNYATVWLFNIAIGKPVGRTYLNTLSIFQKNRRLL